MAARAERRSPSDRDRLLYVLMLRQIECSSDHLSAAYERLAKTISDGTDRDLRTSILNWLEDELASCATPPVEAGQLGTQLMKAAVALSKALKA